MRRVQRTQLQMVQLTLMQQAPHPPQAGHLQPPLLWLQHLAC